MKRNIVLVVDDQEINRIPFVLHFYKKNYQVIECDNGKNAYDNIVAHLDEIAAIFLDLNMPVLDGFGLLKKIKEDNIEILFPIIIITSEENNNQTIKQALDLGATDIIQRELNEGVITKRIENIFSLYETKEQLKELSENQEKIIAQKVQEIKDLSFNTISTMAIAIESRDGDTGNHVNNIYNLTKKMLIHLRDEGFEEVKNLTNDDIEEIAYASILHDVGKIAIPDNILNKPGKLTLEEYEIMKTHTTQGANIIKRIKNPSNSKLMDYAYDICLHHHERYDGRGYPEGLVGDECSLYAQIVAIVDVFDALTQPRVYKKAFTKDEAFNMIKNGECGNFNKNLILILKKVYLEL